MKASTRVSTLVAAWPQTHATALMAGLATTATHVRAELRLLLWGGAVAVGKREALTRLVFMPQRCAVIATTSASCLGA